MDDEVGEEELTKEQWNEVEKRYDDIENDPSQFMSSDEFTQKLNALNHELRSKRT